MLQHALRRQITERGGALPAREALHAPRHAQRLPHQAVEKGAAGAGGARVFPGAAQLRGDLLLAGLGGIKTTGEQKQVLDRSLAGPGAQQPRRLARVRLAPGKCPEYILTRIARGRPVLGGKHHLDPVAGADIENLGGLEACAQRTQPGAEIRARQGEARHLVHARVAIGKSDHADLVHQLA